MRLLLVEDEADFARTLKKALEEEHFAVDVAANGVDALHAATEIPYDAIVLDLMIPGIDGWAVLETLRHERKRVPVLILTARDTLTDKVRGLNLGADDYLTKPFELSELVARVRAAIRRSSGDPAPLITLGDLVIDTNARRVMRGDRPVELTAREYSILELLLRRRGTLVTRPVICEHIYDDEDEVVSNVVDVHVAALRRKLGRDLIQTRRGHGYMIDA